MLYCDKCKLDVAGDRKRCPLCHSILDRTGGESYETFPAVPTVYEQHGLLFRILIMASIAAGVISAAINLMVPQSGWWSLFVLLGLACLWVSLSFGIRKRRNIMKNTVYQVVVLSLLAVLWDALTGWHGWSIDYVIPIGCIAALAFLGIMARIMKLPVSSYMIYLCIAALFGIVPIVFYLTGCLRVLYPSIICVAASVLSLSALIVFEGGNMRDELRRRLHI